MLLLYNYVHLQAIVETEVSVSGPLLQSLNFLVKVFPDLCSIFKIVRTNPCMLTGYCVYFQPAPEDTLTGTESDIVQNQFPS